MGLAKTHLQHILIVVAIHVTRALASFTHPQPTKPRLSPVAALIETSLVKLEGCCAFTSPYCAHRCADPRLTATRKLPFLPWALTMTLSS